MDESRPNTQAGYTLIETLVAFVILSVCTAGFYQAWSISAHALSRADDKIKAMNLSASLLERVGTPDLPLSPGEYVATPEEGLYWHMVIEPYNTNTGGRLQLMSITVEVYSNETENNKLFYTRSLRLGSRVS